VAIFKSGDMRTSETEIKRVGEHRITHIAALQNLGDGNADLLADAQHALGGGRGRWLGHEVSNRICGRKRPGTGDNG
jgi:hypothetical protein